MPKAPVQGSPGPDDAAPAEASELTLNAGSKLRVFRRPTIRRGEARAMADEREFRLSLQEAREDQRIAQREGVPEVGLRSTPEEIVETLKLTDGFDEILEEIPGLVDWPNWNFIAFFSVCSKAGTARWLDIWDVDHFDGWTDMQRSLSDCRAWFSDRGFAGWGSGETRTGQINCYFRAPSDGNYLCTAGLQSYPTSERATVECLIDNSSFGPLSWTGTIYQPHPCALSTGYHHFRIRQQFGSFFFLSLDVQRV
jgi:hypothetical protein